MSDYYSPRCGRQFPIAIFLTSAVGRCQFPRAIFLTSAVGRCLFPRAIFLTSAVGRCLFPIAIYGEGARGRGHNTHIVDTGEGRSNRYALVAAIGAWPIRRPCFAIQYRVHGYGNMVNALCR